MKKRKGVEAHIVGIFKEHRSRYGVRRIVAEMQASGMEVGTCQVRKVLQ